ncbi:hypothetical protein DEM34_06350 [Spiribacter halobius]|uniref:Uncharacterized protein n=1 Tax=Sediminicurvatus halobius TaxID=2182432 RepID=A0A2U2N4X1_9GAMM|nr:hypothetical protein DEM34_06350 [Spiribacter halobius]
MGDVQALGVGGTAAAGIARHSRGSTVSRPGSGRRCAAAGPRHTCRRLGSASSAAKTSQSAALSSCSPVSAWTSQARRYAELADTLDYAYHVTGVVGVMIAMEMNARGDDALDQASDLGITMQLANITRAVVHNAVMGRCCLPARWLTEASIFAACCGHGRAAGPQGRGNPASVPQSMQREW